MPRPLSPNFTLVEFRCHNGTGVPPEAIPELRRLCKHHLEPLRRKFGPVYINSGYRTVAYNASVGGVRDSRHVYGDGQRGVAADVRCSRGSPELWALFLEARPYPNGVGLYDAWVHVDTRSPSVTWDDRQGPRRPALDYQPD